MRNFAVLLVLLAGCDFYFGNGGDDEPPCAGLDYGASQPAEELRNPQTGECEPFGWGGCEDYCGPCPQALSIALPDWGQCSSQCTNLDEADCLTTSGCYAAYDEDGRLLDAPSKLGFKGCWATAPSGPVQGGGCWELDANECSRHDDCSAYYTPEYGPNDAITGSTFSRCAPEATGNGCAAVDCGPGYSCSEQCTPCGLNELCEEPYTCTPVCIPDEPNSCLAVTCGPGTTCVEVCDTMQPTAGNLQPPGKCYATCVPTGTGDPGSCTGAVSCDALPPSCPANTTAGRANGCWTGFCIPNNECGPTDPGTCDGAALCPTLPPACPSGTVPGVRNGCWSGYCIPQHACPQATCETLPTEAACEARNDCTPVYDGSNCTCYPGGGCTCEDLTYARCESWWWGEPKPF